MAIIGDTNADMVMGKNAGLGLIIGVRSGVGSDDDLSPNAHIMVSDVDKVPGILGLESNN